MWFWVSFIWCTEKLNINPTNWQNRKWGRWRTSYFHKKVQLQSNTNFLILTNSSRHEMMIKDNFVSLIQDYTNMWCSSFIYTLRFRFVLFSCFFPYECLYVDQLVSLLYWLATASNCNASKYMSGECGGTTRVGVLIGGNFLSSTLSFGCYLLLAKIVHRCMSVFLPFTHFSLVRGFHRNYHSTL